MKKAINKSFKYSENEIPPALKQRIVDLIFRIRDHRAEPFGLFIILGWKDRWQKFAVIPDSSQDLFRGRNIHQPAAAGQRRISTTLNFDGAILIDQEGNILHSGVMIEGLRPHETATELNPGEFTDLSTQFGFTEKVHTRHLTAITASYKFKGTTVFTISEESGSVHVFEDGKILFTSLKENKSEM